MHGAEELKENTRLAEKAAQHTGETFYLLPRIDANSEANQILRDTLLPFNVKEGRSPDLLGCGKLWEGKTISIKDGADAKKIKQVIENRIKKSKRQADNFIFSLPEHITDDIIGDVINNYLRRTKQEREILIFKGDKTLSFKNTTGWSK